MNLANLKFGSVSAFWIANGVQIRDAWGKEDKKEEGVESTRKRTSSQGNEKKYYKISAATSTTNRSRKKRSSALKGETTFRPSQIALQAVGRDV